MFYLNKWKFVLLIISLISVILLVRESRVFLHVSGYAYDGLVNLSLKNKSAQPDVVIIPLQQQATSDIRKQWPDLIESIMQYNPAAMVIQFEPLNVDAAFYNTVKKYSNIYLLDYAAISAGENKHYILPSQTKAPAAGRFKFIYSAYPQSDDGIYRYQQAYMLNEKESELKSEPKSEPKSRIEEALHNSTLSIVNNKENKHYLINFLAGNNYIPVINSQRLLEGQMISDLIQNKVVLLGEKNNVEAFGYLTPISSSSEKMSLLEFQAYALDTLLKEQAVKEFSLLSLAALFLAQIIISLLIYQLYSRYISLFISILLIVLYVILSWFVLNFYLIRLPLIELILLQLLLYTFVRRYKSIIEDDELQQTLLEISVKNQEHVIPVSFYQSKDPWSQVISLINQTLNLNRLIFLERVPGDHRVKEIKALNCDINDIHEMRRDYEREPYRGAIEASGPVKIDARQYLKNLNDNEDQYLVPLIFGGDILGFWAFAVEKEQIQKTANFLQHVNDYARQIAELIYYRHRFFNDDTDKNFLQRYFYQDKQYSSQQLLNQTIEILNNRLDSLESVFHGMTSANVLYDLFGRVVQINKPMEKFIHDRNIPVYDMTAMDFVHKITRMEVNKIRHMIEQIILEQRQYSMPIMDKEGDDHYVMIIKPLKISLHENIPDLSDANPFQVLGILIELNDLTELQENIIMKEKINEYLFYHFKKEMKVLKEALLSRQKEEIIQVLSEKVSFTISVIDTFEHYMNNDILSFEQYPVDINLVMNQVIEVVTEPGLRDHISIEYNKLNKVMLVMGESQELKTFLSLIMDILVDDAMEDSVISVEIAETEKDLDINISNMGFGLPDREFQNYLFSDAPYVSKEFTRLRTFIQIIEKWGGYLSAHSHIGEGMNFSIFLKKII